MENEKAVSEIVKNAKSLMKKSGRGYNECVVISLLNYLNDLRKDVSKETNLGDISLEQKLWELYYSPSYRN